MIACADCGELELCWSCIILMRIVRSVKFTNYWSQNNLDFNLYSQHHLTYALSKDTDVALWLHHRAYNKFPPLSDDGNFVIVSTEVHDNFDDFKSKEVEPGYSYLELLHDASTVNKYGVTFVCLHASENWLFVSVGGGTPWKVLRNWKWHLYYR